MCLYNSYVVDPDEAEEKKRKCVTHTRHLEIQHEHPGSKIVSLRHLDAPNIDGCGTEVREMGVSVLQCVALCCSVLQCVAVGNSLSASPRRTEY